MRLFLIALCSIATIQITAAHISPGAYALWLTNTNNAITTGNIDNAFANFIMAEGALNYDKSTEVDLKEVEAFLRSSKILELPESVNELMNLFRSVFTILFLIKPTADRCVAGINITGIENAPTTSDVGGMSCLVTGNKNVLISSFPERIPTALLKFAHKNGMAEYKIPGLEEGKADTIFYTPAGKKNARLLNAYLSSFNAKKRELGPMPSLQELRKLLAEPQKNQAEIAQLQARLKQEATVTLNHYLFGKLLGYKEEDITAFYKHIESSEQLIKDKKEADDWIKNNE